MVLVIDDDDGVRDAIVDVLVAEQVEARGVGTATEAFAYLENNPPPGLILLDQVLPDMPGTQIREHLLTRPELAVVPVVLMSASTAVDSEDACRALAGRLRKPFNLEALLSVIRPFTQPGKPGVG
jgi:CheY-like chemotaxis protein